MENMIFSVTDEQAMWRVQMHDDASAFQGLLKRWQGPIQRLCTRMLGDVHRAEDLTQETFARIYAKRKEYQATARFSTFLWRVALNLCYDELRRQKRRPEVPLESDEEGGPRIQTASETEAPDEALAHHEDAKLVQTALGGLPEVYQTVLVLRHYQNLKFREIADVLGIPEGTVKSRMAEALSLLQKKIHFTRKSEERSVNRIKPAFVL